MEIRRARVANPTPLATSTKPNHTSVVEDDDPVTGSLRVPGGMGTWVVLVVSAQFIEDPDDDPMATCIACGADTFDLSDIGEVRNAGKGST